MSQKLYEEALADARKVTEVAENNAKQAVLAAVLPRIKSLIENELLGTSSGEAMSTEDILGSTDSVEDLELDDAVSQPDAEGKVTLDLDALNVDKDAELNVAPGTGNDEFELSLESRNTLKALRSIKNSGDLKTRMKMLESTVAKVIKDKNVKNEQISQMISNVEHTYEYVQESLNESNDKEAYESKLETFFKELTKIQETLMSKNRKLNEEEELDLDDASGDDVDLDAVDADDDGAGAGELTLTLTGLPDGVDLDGIGVDLVGADEDGAGDEEVSDDDEVLDLDLDSGDDQGGDVQMSDDDQGEEVQMESDEMVEIDEGMLRREIKRMALLREAAENTDSNGHGVGPKEFDDFGDATDQGEAFLDGEVTTESDEVCETDAMDVSETRKALQHEANRQAKMKTKLSSLKREGSRSRGAKLASIKENYRRVMGMLNASVKLSTKYRTQLSESRNRKIAQSRPSNSVVSQSADKTVQNLRKKLAESNLQSVKLAYANKVLQSEALNPKQRAQVFKALNECRTPREAKLVYTSVVKRLGTSQRRLKENTVVGSSSRSTRSSSSSDVNTLNEGADIERWSKLAGINK